MTTRDELMEAVAHHCTGSGRARCTIRRPRACGLAFHFPDTAGSLDPAGWVPRRRNVPIRIPRADDIGDMSDITVRDQKSTSLYLVK